MTKNVRSQTVPNRPKITDTANWYNGRLNGEPIFAIYSSVYHNNSTILYEVRGKNALKELDILLDLMENIENEQNNIKGKVAIDEIFGINWVQQGSNMANSNVGSGRGNSHTRNVTVYKGKSSKHIGSKAFRNVVKNLFEIQYGEVRKSKPDTAPDESITPPKIRTTAQLKQGAFELDERVRKKLEQQAENHGDSGTKVNGINIQYIKRRCFKHIFEEKTDCIKPKNMSKNVRPQMT